jgi:phage terminase large subunit
VTSAVQIALPPKLKPLFIGPADVRGAYGGRGSAKTRSFAKMCAVKGVMFGNQGIGGIILCARQYMNSLDDSSLEEVKRAIEEEPFLANYYDLGDKYIKSRDGRIEFAFAGLDRSINSIKSKGRILLCWVDEAEPVTDEAWQVLEPTLREEGTDWNAELWVTWNPKRKKAACEKRFRHAQDPLIRMVEMNWRDNPKFPDVLERKRQRCLAETPDEYEHVWEGKYVSAISGAYYSKNLIKARAEHRIGHVAADPLLTIRLFCDIGGTGAKADAFTIWPKQFVGREIRCLDYYEAVGQPIGTHLHWLRKRGYTKDRAQIVLPHDGETHDRVYDVSYESAFKAAGYDVTVIPNQGKGAAKQRIEAARRHFDCVHFNAPDGVDWEERPTCAAGLEALGWYHEKKDEDRDIGLGPEHDWSSHGADSFGLGMICVERIWAESNKSVADPYAGMRRAHG